MLSGLFPAKPKAISKAPKVKFPSERKALLQKFMKGLSINFKHIELLDLAFHHRSFSNERGGGAKNNERLEFLGDSVLGLCTATYLYETLTDKSEGELSKIKSVVVSEQTLAGIALDIGIDRCLVLGNGEEHSGGRTKKAILADAVEAVMGAYFQDSGFVAADKLVRALIVPEIDKVLDHKAVQDYKSLLQEYYQKRYKQYPRYELVKNAGPEHDRTFTVTVHLDRTTYGPEIGKSKKEAEQAAAQKACEALGLVRQ